MKKQVKKRELVAVCHECGHKFYTVPAATRAAWNGCPGCNGLDIGLPDVRKRRSQ